MMLGGAVAISSDQQVVPPAAGICVQNTDGTCENAHVKPVRVRKDIVENHESDAKSGSQRSARTASSSTSSSTYLPLERELHEDTEREFPTECQLYMAQSSIPNAGIGIFTATDLTRNQFVGEGEMLIPLTDIMFNDFWLIDDVQWDTGLDPRLYFESHLPNSIYYPGFGAQINCHMGLNNVEHTLPKYDSANLHRSTDPGAGAFTNWHSMGNKVIRDVKAGEELFTNYGDSWFIQRHRILGDIPLSKDYPVADDIVQKLHKIAPSPSEPWQPYQDLLDTIRANLKPRTAAALPTNWYEISSAAKYGVARHFLGADQSYKSLDWLKEHGACVDHIYVKLSSIPQAGRGAFAKRKLLQGQIVSPAPVLQILRSQTLVYEPFENNPDDYDPDHPVGIQLLRNYAWGHPHSSMLFLPYSPNVNFINHAHKELANVKIRWSENPINRKDWFDLEPEKVVSKGFGLLMEFIALRDIEPHEEILVDYGDDWQNAWDRHVATWSPTQHSHEYTQVDLVEQEVIRTETEQKRAPYPPNIDTACYFAHTSDTEYEQIKGKQNHFVAEWNTVNYDCLRYCSILRRHNATDGTIHYSVKVRPSKTSSLPSDCWISQEETVFVKNVPSYAVQLVDKKLSRDQHLSNAFRHEIGLPTDMLPQKWLDTPQEYQKFTHDRFQRSPSKTKMERNLDEVDKRKAHGGSDQCKLYLAESSIPDSGIGIYTAVDLKEGELLGEGEIAVPLVNFSKPWMLPDEVFWNKDAVEDLLLFEGLGPTDSFIPGFGAQINCHMGLNNVEHSYAQIKSAGLSPSKDYGSGARSIWGNVTNIATRDIKAGEELFIDYGEHWFNYRKLGHIPMYEDFVVADDILGKITSNKLLGGEDYDNEIAQDVLDMIRNMESVRVRNALPKRIEDLREAQIVGTARFSIGGKESIRSQAWLEAHGSCIDNLYVASSSIQQAGLGAFSKRALKKDSVIAPAPLLHLPKSNLLYRQFAQERYQLLLNYCFGHPNSQVLLLPYSPVVNYINHGWQGRINAQIRWSSKNKKEWLDLPDDQILKKGFGLSMEFVALRDIEPNEEILIDYGEEWQEAWERHAQEWQPTAKASDYQSPSAFNSRKAEEIRTVKDEPYPFNIGTACYYVPYRFDRSEGKYDHEAKKLFFYHDWSDSQHGCLRPCNILDISFGQGDSFTVTAEMKNVPELAENCFIQEGQFHIISNVPDSAMMFVDKPFTRAPYLGDNIFRHYIGLPEGVFPNAWMNIE